MSFVDMQPSESSRSKVTAVAARSARSAVSSVDVGVGGQVDEHGRQRGRQHARALGHPADGVARLRLDGRLLASRCPWSGSPRPRRGRPTR